MSAQWITSADDPQLLALCQQLRTAADTLDTNGTWPAEQLRWLGKCGVWSWFVPAQWGGQDWPDVEILKAYTQLGRACLTTAFILTQWTGACRRIAGGNNPALRDELLPPLVRGEQFATVAISHLTTSRRHLGKPALRAEPIAGGYRLQGFSPWVTGGAHADHIVTGAALEDGRQILLAVPTGLPGIVAEPPLRLTAVSASATGQITFDNVRVAADRLLAGPADNVMAERIGGQTGGLATSALALGVATSAIDFLRDEAHARPALTDPAEGLDAERGELYEQLVLLAQGGAGCPQEELRARANSLALRATQSALAAAKGTGYVWGHRAGRLCREALFFLVWSCPQPVMSANLCEFAGLAD